MRHSEYTIVVFRGRFTGQNFQSKPLMKTEALRLISIGYWSEPLYIINVKGGVYA